mmetsp:Transcript_10368/g.17111  ORF Transcript_10368/g.17111 Transcript_10368/m.17111 type:complete len:89 (-) Transcript_10368:699-965(-)
MDIIWLAGSGWHLISNSKKQSTSKIKYILPFIISTPIFGRSKKLQQVQEKIDNVQIKHDCCQHVFVRIQLVHDQPSIKQNVSRKDYAS